MVGLLLGLVGYIFFINYVANYFSFLIGFVSGLLLLSCAAVLLFTWNRKKILVWLFGPQAAEQPAENNQLFVKGIIGHLVDRLFSGHMHEDSRDQIKRSGMHAFNMFMWGRVIISMLGVLASVFIVLGGLLGTILVVQQNKMLGQQNVLINKQNLYLGQQTDYINKQTNLLDVQTDLLAVQNKNLVAQNSMIGQQTGLFHEQVGQIDTQNDLFFRQIGQVDNQNLLVKEQTSKIEQQTELLESDRRSALIFMMSNIMDKIDDEIKTQTEKDRQVVKYSLSDPVLGRIGALSQSFKPYRYLQNGALIEKPLSPERGQLLLALTNSEIKEADCDKLFTQSTFEFADLKSSRLDSAYLAHINLKSADLSNTELKYANLADASLNHSDLRNSRLNGANLSNAHLDYSSLQEANLDDANLKGAELYYSNLSNASLAADFTEAKLNHAKLDFAILNYAILERAELLNATLKGAKLIKSKLNQADLTKASLEGARLQGAELADANLLRTQCTGADFSGAILLRSDLTGSDLSQANFTGADLQEANLTAADLRGVIWKNARLEKLILRDAKVSSPTWLSDLSNLALATGIEDLLSRYGIDALAPQSDLKGTFFLIKERPGLQ